MIRRQSIEAIQDAGNLTAQKRGVPQTTANPGMTAGEKLTIVSAQLGTIAQLLLSVHSETFRQIGEEFGFDGSLAHRQALQKALAELAADCGMWMDALDDAV